MRLPCLLIAPSFCLPPEECSRGINNHHRKLLSSPASSSSNKDYMGSNRAFTLIPQFLL
jgi:hypothetical protein